MKYFKLAEFDSPDQPGSGDRMDRPLLVALERIREDFGKPVVVNSAYRTKAHNKAVGGVSNSQHLLGKAVDIHINNQKEGDTLEALAKKYIGLGGIGRYNTFIHVDNREYNAYWDKRK